MGQSIAQCNACGHTACSLNEDCNAHEHHSCIGPCFNAKVLVQVDASALGLHDYHQVIRRPMDLGTIKKGLMADEGAYSSSAEVLKDVQQVWTNCRTYNDEDDPIMYVHYESIHSRLLQSFSEPARTDRLETAIMVLYQ